MAYAFPPINRSGTHRTLGFVKHLDRLGWDATVLTVEPRGEPLDEQLSGDIPASTTVLQTPWIDWIARIKESLPAHRRADRPSSAAGGTGPPRRSLNGAESAVEHTMSTGFRDWFTRALQTPDSRIGWIGPAVRAGLREIRRRRPELLYSTSPYMSAHLIALRLSRRTGLPWVADFRDPWTANPFRQLPYRSLRRWDAWLELRVLRHASHIISCSPTMTAQMCARYPLIRKKCSTILNGFDRDRLDRIEPRRPAPGGGFVLTHCGQFYGTRTPHVWFAALRRALQQEPKLADRIRFVLLGPETFDGQSLRDLAASFGVAACVRILGPKSHTESLAHMAGSDALALGAATGPHGDLQVPNKLFEYLAVQKPIIATCCEKNPIARILDSAGAEAIVCDPDDGQALADAIRRLAMGRRIELSRPWAGVEAFDRSHRAAELARIFQQLAPAEELAPVRATARSVAPTRESVPLEPVPV